MKLRLLTVLLVLAAALSAVVPAAAWATDGGESGTNASRVEPEDPEPIPDFWTEEEPASGSGGGGSTSSTDAPRSSGDTSTSPGGTAPGSGTVTTGPGAQVPTSPTRPSTRQAAPAEDAPVCDPSAGLRRALRALRRAVRGHDLLAASPRPVAVRVAPCVPGTVELAVVVAGGDTVLWRARRELRTTRPATLRLTMTSAGRRFVARARRDGGGVVRMRLRARLYPAAR
jgi:hypothetical protein